MSVEEAVSLCITLGVQPFDLCWEIGFGFPNLLFTLAAFSNTVVIGNDINIDTNGTYDQVYNALRIAFYKEDQIAFVLSKFLMYELFNFKSTTMGELERATMIIKLLDKLKGRFKDLTQNLAEEFYRKSIYNHFFTTLPID